MIGDSVSTVKLVDTLSNGESFQFRGMEWFITEDEVLKQENIDKDDIEIRPNPPTVIKYPHAITFEETELNVEVILYNFNDEPHMFVPGEYFATFEDKENYLATVEKVKSTLETEFNRFFKIGEDFSPLISGDSIKWFAEDKSSLTFSVFFDNADTKRVEPYTIKYSR